MGGKPGKIARAVVRAMRRRPTPSFVPAGASDRVYQCVRCRATRAYRLTDKAFASLRTAPHVCAACGGALVRGRAAVQNS